MSDIELYELFQSLCKEYIDMYEAIVLKNNDSRFKLLSQAEKIKGILYLNLQ